MLKRKVVILSLLVLALVTGRTSAETIDFRLRIRDKSSDEKIITRANLIRIQQFILKHGLCETYCNMYNNNPAFRTKSFSFYLNPDTGQENINCDTDKSDFHTLTIRKSEGGKNQYRTVEFLDKHYVYIVVSWPTKDLTVSKARGVVIEAIKEILKEMEKEKPNKPDAGDESMWAGNATQPVPEGAKVTLEFDRPDYFLGENVLMHFVLQNTGDTPFEASWGHDYRGASRHLRFKVTATDEAGQAAEDPDPSDMCMGGLGGPETLKPGEKFTTSLPLMRYCQIDQPGLYRIRATHDFGWREGERKRPVGETTITFRMPDAAKAEWIVSRMENLPNTPNAIWGRRSRDYADFGCLRQPVYLEPLVCRARGGDTHAFEGLGRMATLEATEALIRLAGDSDSNLALDAARTLTGRLPHPEFDKSLPGQGRLRIGRFPVRRRLAERAWDARFAPAVRALATNFLARKETSHISRGALIIEAVGTKEEAPAVLAAIDRALEPLHQPRSDPKDNILDFPQPVRELLRAMQALRSRGFAVGRSVSGRAQILLYFQWLADEAPPRPSHWLQMLDAFGAAGQYPLRESALRSIPQPMPAECTKFVTRGLADPDLGVCRAACAVAGKSGDKELIKPLLEIIATEHHDWLLREASNAAQALGAGFDLLEVWADRLAEERLYHLALDALQTVLEVPSGGYSGRTDLIRTERLELRKAWKEFLARHTEEIRNGKRFRLSDPTVTPALVGRARSWRLPDGTSWPVSTQKAVPN